MKLLISLLGAVALLCSLSCNEEINAEKINDTKVQSPADEIKDVTPTAALSEVKADAGTSSAEVARPTDSEPSANNDEKNEAKSSTTALTDDKKVAEPTKVRSSKTSTAKKKVSSSSNTERKKRSKGTPQAAFKETVHEFGVIGQGEKVEHNFVFENIGDADLEILNVDVTCGCTIPTFPFIPIAPGEKGTIGVTYNSTGKLGSQKPMITVITNAKPSTYKLYFKGVVDADRAKLTPTGSEEN